MAETESESEAPKEPSSEPAKGSADKTPWALFAAGLAIALALTLYLRSQKPNTAPSSGASGDVIQELERQGRQKAARGVRDACGSSSSCACRQATAHAALDANLHAQALTALSGDANCSADATSRGMQAEAFARAGKNADALALARELLQKDPGAAFATYALAHASYSTGDVATAMQEATHAVERGRGAPAHLLLGLIALRGNDAAGARSQFEKMLVIDPDDVDALYNLAFISQTQGRYREAREGYLRVLKLAPANLDARYNLGVLTHSVGANDEARHHLAELERIAPPGDGRVTRLRALVAEPAPAAPGVVSGNPAEPRK